MKTYISMATLTGISWAIGSYAIIDSVVNSNLLGFCFGAAISAMSAINFAYWQKTENKK